MRPVSVEDLRVYRDFDLRAFVIAVLLGAATTVIFWTQVGPSNNTGATAATMNEVSRFAFGVLVVGPVVALAISRSGRWWTALAAIPAVFLVASAILLLR